MPAPVFSGFIHGWWLVCGGGLIIVLRSGQGQENRLEFNPGEAFKELFQLQCDFFRPNQFHVSPVRVFRPCQHRSFI